ncbi:PAS domain-containing sensor histidine kinase [Hwanghaeella grinnelliae]|uniref:histidine kinase n=1 Tax=Hwanghaeella grinnelliae TaxID=2500179 RepID=A0A3S2VM85_9PROT|nr:PAS domain-containing sensor histidine kinase [Hwanghaeella grinnelliae]RVU36133.1 PAS domain-containing sensor histidine kinase [Hwanghaeella grinnelliae]
MADGRGGTSRENHDATHHVRDALILRESIQEFPGPVAVYDSEDRLIACNELYRWVHGTAFERVQRQAGANRIRYEDLVRESAVDVVPLEEFEAHVADRLRAQREANTKPIDRYYPNRGWFRITKVRTPSGAVVGFATDVTELKEKTVALEEARAAAEAANIAKSAFLANMSHELRTPLNAIIGLSEALGHGVFGDLDEKHKNYIQDIRNSGNHLLALISDLLDLAKVEAGKMEMDWEAFDLNGLISECMAMMSPIAGQKSVMLESDLPPGGLLIPDQLGTTADLGTNAALVTNSDVMTTADLMVNADRRKIKQALLNILSNAVKYSDVGGSVRISIARTEQQLEIKIRDNGIGIDKEQLDFVFEPFGRVQSTFTAMPDGAGLGLPIARRLMELHGGDIAIESNPGDGTTVTLQLPSSILL